MDDISYIEASDIKIVQDAQRNFNEDIEVCISDLVYLSELLKQFKTTINDSVNASTEYVNILQKYNDIPNVGAYNLPGIFASAVGQYDIDDARNDSEQMKDCLTKKTITDRQRDTQYNQIVKVYNDIKHKLNDISNGNQQMFTYISKLIDETTRNN